MVVGALQWQNHIQAGNANGQQDNEQVELGLDGSNRSTLSLQEPNSRTEHQTKHADNPGSRTKCDQVALLSEPLVADAADKGLLPSVGPLVLSQVALLNEAFSQTLQR